MDWYKGNSFAYSISINNKKKIIWLVKQNSNKFCEDSENIFKS